MWILSIDGGGIRGLIPAIILDKLEKEVSMKRGKDVRIADIFDMVAGTSTGSIISLGLTVSDNAKNPRPKYQASDMVKLYNEEGKKVFGSISRWSWIKMTSKLLADETEQEPAVDIFDPTYFSANTNIEGPDEGLLKPSYSGESLEKLLSEKFEDKSLKDTVSNVDVLVPAYNITSKKEFYFTNDPCDPNTYKISDVIRACTAAPTYFPAKQIGSSYYVDGGIFMNNPAFKAYLEAKKKNPQAKKFVVCSLGTGFFQAELEGLANSGWISWMSPVIDLMMNASSKTTEGYLESLKTEQDFHYYRLQYNLSEDIPLDDTKTETLRKLAVFANVITEGTEFKKLVEEIVENEKLKDQ